MIYDCNLLKVNCTEIISEYTKCYNITQIKKVIIKLRIA